MQQTSGKPNPNAFSLSKHADNVHELFFSSQTSVKIAQLSDLHWDNPKCDHDYLKRTLDYCLANSIPVVVNGDFFCLMQGRGDRRSSKSDIRPEHNNAQYLDSVVETAVAWFAPYAPVLAIIGYGNHETAIIKHQETDLLRRFVALYNSTHGANVQIGGYGGWIIYKIDTGGNRLASFRHKYFHGSGGGGVVTRGEINLTRAMAATASFDIFSIGHIHENKATDVVMDALSFHSHKGFFVELKTAHLMVTGTFKEEYADGSKGWHVERGAPPKPLGGRILELIVNREPSGLKKIVRSYKFPF